MEMTEVKAMFCLNCNARLTEWLTAIDTAEAAAALCDFREPGANKEKAIEPVSSGFVLEMSYEVQSELGVTGTLGGRSAHKIWFNPKDFTGCVLWSAEIEWKIGCCDVDGYYGPNRECQCGRIVGTEFADCYQWHVIEAEQKNTYWKT